MDVTGHQEATLWGAGEPRLVADGQVTEETGTPLQAWGLGCVVSA